MCDAWVDFGMGVIEALHQIFGIVWEEKTHLVMWRRAFAKFGAVMAMERMCLVMEMSPVEVPEVKLLTALMMSAMVMDDGGCGFMC